MLLVPRDQDKNDSQTHSAHQGNPKSSSGHLWTPRGADVLLNTLGHRFLLLPVNLIYLTTWQRRLNMLFLLWWLPKPQSHQELWTLQTLIVICRKMGVLRQHYDRLQTEHCLMTVFKWVSPFKKLFLNPNFGNFLWFFTSPTFSLSPSFWPFCLPPYLFLPSVSEKHTRYCPK